jgi:hypothetical protein
MKLEAPTDADSLAALGDQAINLLCRGDFEALALQYGYALSYGRETAAAIRDDLGASLSRVGATVLAPRPAHSACAIRFYKPNSSNLAAVIECLVPTDNDAAVLVELVVTRVAAETHITLEDISTP